MKPIGQFQRRALLLFLIVSVLPALTVSALWWVYTKDIAGAQFINFGQLVAPVALVGLLPAIIVAILFAELLAIPIRRLHQGIIQISIGDYKSRTAFSTISEFREMAEALNSIASNLQQTLSQKDSENDLIAAERNKLHSVLNNMKDGVFALDHSNRILLFNKAASALTGRSMERAAGQPVEEVLPLFKDNQPILLTWLMSQPQSSDKSNHWTDVELRTVDGKQLRVDLEISLTPDDPNGIRALVTFHDLTKSRELEDMEVNFVALAAHELRTPLTTIKGYLDILRTELGKRLSAEHRTFLERSANGVNQLSGLVNNLLNVSRIEHGELSYNLEQVDWLDFLNDIKAELTERSKHNDRKLVLKLARKLPKVGIDHVAMREVLYNLIDNAIKYTSPGDIITLTVHEAHDGVETTVSDTGTGIPKDSLDRLFTKFYRVEGLRSKEGTGLGLYICKSIVEAHYGYIWVESQFGRGSTFGFNLPIYKTIAHKVTKPDNKNIIRGTHGWIKAHSHHRRRPIHK